MSFPQGSLQSEIDRGAAKTSNSTMGISILGVDPGSRVAGYGFIEVGSQRMKHLRHGVIRLEEGTAFELRLAQLSHSFRRLLQETVPQAVIFEKVFLGKNVESAFRLGHARGVLMAEAASQNIPIFEYAARQVKKGVTGKGAAEKTEVQMVVQRLLHLPHIQWLDASDALALACHHAFEQQKQSILRRAVESGL